MHESLGDRLRKARKASDSSIEDVAFRAKIPKPVIEALEAENFGFFTSPLYARSFLKQYGESIGADVEPWLADFVPAVMIDSDSVESILGGPESPSEHTSSPETEKDSGAIWGPIWIFLITIAAIWGGIKVYEIFDSEHSKPQPSNDPALMEEVIPEASPQPLIDSPPNDSETPKRAIIVETPLTE